MNIEEVIEKSRYLLTLPENFDGMGSLPCGSKAWTRTSNFLRKEDTMWKRDSLRNANLPEPEITPGPEGSIDLYWKTWSISLIVNIPENSEICTFYGKSRWNEVKGSFISEKEYLDSSLIFTCFGKL